MRKLTALMLAFACWLTAQAQPSQPCEATPAIEKELKRLDTVSGAARKTLFDELFARYPDDVFLHLRYIETTLYGNHVDRRALAARYAKLAEEHPSNERFTFLKAVSLEGLDTPQAIALLSPQKSNPGAHLELADIYSWGKFADKSQSKTELTAFFSECPNSWNSRAWNQATRFKDAPTAGAYALRFRKQLQSDTKPDHFALWSNVWNLEFKARPVPQHDELRKQVALDIERLRLLRKDPEDAGWLSFLKSGYTLAGDAESVRKMEAALLERFPTSSEAGRIADERWEKEHPWPSMDSSTEVKQAHYQAELNRANDTLKLRPGDTQALFEQFSAISSLENSTISQVTEAADALLAAVHAKEDLQLQPPVEFIIARAYVDKRTRVPQVPALLDAGWKGFLAENANGPDNYPEEYKSMRAQSHQYVSRERANILLEAALQLGKPEIAKEAVEAVLAGDKPKRPELLWEIQAKWADLQGRKLDALLLYRAVLDARSPSFKPPKKDEIADSIERLRSELGGTAETQALWEKKGATSEVAKEGRWETPAKDMPLWELGDLKGKTWKLASLEGKAVLINVWATWCGPCRMEQPHLEALYKSLKDRQDIQIVTFNVDDEIGQVEPFMKEHGYTFPVLLANEYVKALLPALSIPRNWIVDSKGKWRLEQIGFGGEEGWEAAMIEKLGSLK